MADAVPEGYVQLGQKDVLPAGEPGLEKVRTHYQKKACRIYYASKKALSRKGKKGADFIVVCAKDDVICVAIIDCKDGNRSCSDAPAQFKDSVAAAKAAGYVGAGANPRVSLVVFNGTLKTMADTDTLDKDAAQVEVGTDKKKGTLVTAEDRLPC